MSIELKAVTKKFGDTTVVNSVTFSVKEGELMALLGPSGGGKTTVLRMIAGLEMPTAGDVFIRGKRVNDVSVQQRNIGFVFQNYALFKNMTVFKNIAFGLKIKKWKQADIEARIAELLKLFGLEGLERRYPHQLSGGQRQRVAIARALAPKPSVLLLDEPFGAVDAKIRQELREWLVTLHHDLNVTTIFVTHDQEEALEVANRIVIFSRGMHQQIPLRKSLQNLLELAAGDRCQRPQPRQLFIIHICMHPLVGAAVQVILGPHVELPNVLRLPRRQRLRIHRLDVGISQQAQHLQALRRSHFVGKCRHRLRIENVAPQCRRHLQVTADQELNVRPLFRINVQPVHGTARNVQAGLHVIAAGYALSRVVQQQG